MLRVYYKTEKGLTKEIGLVSFKDIPEADVIWVDLQNPTPEEEEIVETYFNIQFQSQQQASEIESSSRYIETESSTIINSNFLESTDQLLSMSPVSFILKDRSLFSYRFNDLKTFAETVKKIKAGIPIDSGTQVLAAIFETQIDLDADLIESIARGVSQVSRQISSKASREEILLQITSFQETTMMLRENIVDKQRVIAAFLRSTRLNPNDHERFRTIIKDINSLLEHISFAFDRLEYLQDSVLGLINLDLNKIIKIFTIISVAFTPPTLIASIYGMNFKVIPELDWAFGYPMAISLMLASALITLWLFRRRGWL